MDAQIKMASRKNNLFLKRYGWLLSISSILLITLIALSQVLQSSEQFAQFYATLLLVSFVGVSVLGIMLFVTLKRLRRNYVKKRAGSIITSKLTILISLIIIIPLLVTYFFSISFINKGIDQWFDVKTEQALADAVSLVKISLDDQRRNHLKSTVQAAKIYQEDISITPVLTINKIRKQFNMSEAALYTLSGRLISFSSKITNNELPKTPKASLFQQMRQGHTYAAIETLTSATGNYQIIRIMVPVTNLMNKKVLVLHALYSIPDQLSHLADSVRISAGQYQELSYLKDPLKTSFTVVLTVLLLLTLVSAILFTIKVIENLIEPIRTLAKGTKAVAKGDYSVSVPVISDDDLGQLTTSFNDMIQQISLARNETKFSHQQTKVQQLYLQAVIQNLNSGVITLDMNLRLKTVNDAANKILDANLFSQLGVPLKEVLLLENKLHIQPLFDNIFPLFTNESESWSKQFTYDCLDGQKILLTHGSTLPSLDKKHGGFVIVIEDITELVQAQLHSAWSDVAKRLAHEIKNPLTPIQLSAERLQYKLAPQLPMESLPFLNRMTDTIIAQVASMQELVQAFAEYADTPDIEILPFHLNNLIADICSMYSHDTQTYKVITKLDKNCDIIYADASKLRQLLHNLIKNAIEACEEEEGSTLIMLSTECTDNQVLLCVADNGPGIPEAARNWIFEPYATDKPKGTGLGLAIVKKIIDEHRGKIKVESIDKNESVTGHGTKFHISLPKNNKIKGV